jgi:hypothetical protein
VIVIATWRDFSIVTINYKKEKVVVNIESLDNFNDPEELERLSHNLRDELNELDVIEKVDLITKEGEQAPKGSKSGGEVAMLGSLLVTLGGSLASNMIPSLANTLQSWVTRQDRHTLSLEIGGDNLQLTGVSDKCTTATVIIT